MTGSPPLPTGTVTFLFTDIEGSTRLAAEHGAAYERLLETQRRLIGEAVGPCGGALVGSEGDSLFVAFDSATSAAQGAAEAQRALAAHAWPENGLVRVRMGLHTGEAALVGDDYVGYEVHRAARIAAAGHGGQIVVSDPTRALIQGSLPPGTTTTDLGRHRLKDLGDGEQLYQLTVEGLASEFPALRSLDQTPNNLPTQLTSFIGRRRELEESRRLLSSSAGRLLTLTGPGGTGKTRLSLQIAASVADEYPDGVYFVALAPITDPDLVPSVIARTLGIQEAAGRPPLERLLEYLPGKCLLLVLDNFEQVLPAAGVLGQMLKVNERLGMIVSSRAALRIYGEQEFPVPPLGLPSAGALSVDSLSQYEAVTLFIERALAVKPDFRITNDNAAAVAEICARLDGLPLAIELAAARVKLLPPQAMLSRLQSRLNLLGTGGARDLPARQQTLRGAIEWSHDLLDEGSRRLFARLGVFVGGATLDQVEEVCGPASEIGVDILDGLAGLVDQSLVRQREINGEPRFLMLETIREFAVERLQSGGNAAEIGRRHAAAYLALAEALEPELIGPEPKVALDRLDLEHHNIRAALTWAIEEPEPATALRLVAAMWRFWHMRGHLHEARERVEAALAVPGRRELLLEWGRAQEAAGGIAYWQGDLSRATPHYQESLVTMRRLGDRRQIANALYNVAFTVSETPDHPTSWQMSTPYLEEALAIYRELGDRPGLANVLWGLGNSRYFASDPEAAVPLFRESLELYREQKSTFGISWSLYMLAGVMLNLGDVAEARQNNTEALRMFRAVGDISGIVLGLATAAAIAAADGDPHLGARLAGASMALEASTGTRLASFSTEAEGRGELVKSWESEGLAEAVAEGRALSVEKALELALSPGSGSVSETRTPAPEEAGGEAVDPLDTPADSPPG
ncbi:MAG: tetratricopeptide repeat protein [Chloroflexi bacterium]|nr:tetratricopeptide repeat protein [Chloroflexota bacterium]